MDHDELTDRAREAAFTAVGFCVLGFQQLQVRRRELARDLSGRLGEGGDGASDLQRFVRQAEAVVDPVLDGVERVLPIAARTAVHQGRTAAKVLRKVLL